MRGIGNLCPHSFDTCRVPGVPDNLRTIPCAPDVGPDADVAAVKRLCIDGEADGRWYHEEGSVTPEWIAS